MPGLMLKIGSVPYLNARPLLAGLSALPEASLLLLPPARLAGELRAGRLDAALLPVFEPLSHRGYRVVDGAAIASDGPVRSVLLYCRVPPAKVRLLAPDPDSLTSNALARILLSERTGAKPREAPPETADAVLAIGDRALRGLPGDWAEILDLGEAWKALAGLPFVYALWTLGPGAPEGTADLLRRAARRGTADLPAAVRDSGFPEGLALDYLRSALCYGLGERERAGLSAFAGRARQEGLLNGTHELEWA